MRVPQSVNTELSKDATEDENVVALSRVVEIQLSDKGEPPTEFMMFSAGMNPTTKGNFNFSPRSSESVMASAADMGMRQNIDYEHASMSPPGMSPDPAETHKSAGRYDLECRDGNCYASNVKWTPAARQKIINREFSHISPVFRPDEDGTILEVRCCALTNDPATKHQKPLVAASTKPTPGEESHMLQHIVTMLSLKAGATEADAVAALSSRLQAETELLALTDSKTVSEAKGKLLSWKDSAGKFEALSKENAELKAKTRKSDVDALLAKAQADGRVVPAEVESLSKMGMSDFEQLSSYLAVKPKVVVIAPDDGKGGAKPAGGENMVALSVEDKQIAEMFGNDHTKLSESKAKVRSMRVDNIGAREVR